MSTASFFRVITEAVADFVRHGFDSQARLDQWMARIAAAAQESLTPMSIVQTSLRTNLERVFTREMRRLSAPSVQPAISGAKPRFTAAYLQPMMRAELDRRIAASSQLIKLNRARSIETTLSRFSGWATSIPAGGSKSQDKREESTRIRKSLAQLPFEERRVAIDQGHKLVASVNAVYAQGTGAIAAIWHSNWRQPGYNYRPDHKERDGDVYLLRDSWAVGQGLVKPGPAGWSDKITQPAEEPFCRCHFQYIYNLKKLPQDMLTVKGQALLDKRAHA